MLKWIATALIFGPITTVVVYLCHRWYSTPERVKARHLKKIRKSQQRFCDW